MTQLNVYLRFNGNCREAMIFYKECLGGELNLQTVEGSPVESHMPAEAKNNILHATLRKGALLLLGSDMQSTIGRQPGNNVALSLNCSSEEEIQSFFTNLSSGGIISYPLHTEFWGASFGVLTDKYGNEWMLNYEKNVSNS